MRIFSQRCWINEELQPATILIYNGTIQDIRLGPISRDFEILNVGKDVLMPGIIDAHVHINEPGRTLWEGFDTATRAAAAGGTTTIVDMPLNSDPVTVSTGAFQEKLDACEGKLHVNCGFWGGVIPQSLNDLPQLLKSGVLGIKVFLIHSGIDEFPKMSEEELQRAMPLIAEMGLPILAHCEIYSAHAGEDQLRESPVSYRAYLASRPKIWENEAIEMMIDLSRKTQCMTHIVHLCSSEGLAMIAAAKKENLPVTVETCPHYLLFEAERIGEGATIYKCAPPIREKENNDLLKLAVKKGEIDFLASDHSPAHPEIKKLEEGDFRTGWGGIAGLQFLLPASWTSLLDHVDLESFIPLLTVKPAEFLGIDDRKGKIGIGMDADLVVWSPEELFDVIPDEVAFRHKISPYIGQRLKGRVKKTILGGEIIWKNGKLIQELRGKTILRKIL